MEELLRDNRNTARYTQRQEDFMTLRSWFKDQLKDVSPFEITWPQNPKPISRRVLLPHTWHLDDRNNQDAVLPWVENLSELRLDRRTLLQASAFLGILAAEFGSTYTLAKLGEWAVLAEQAARDRQKVQEYETPEEFFEDNKDWLVKFKLEYNFSLDHFLRMWNGYIPYLPQTIHPIPTPHEIATFIRDIGMDNGRFVIWQKSAADLQGNVNTNFYDKHIEAFKYCGLEMTPVVGIKTPREPELHPVDELMQFLFGDNIPTDFGHPINPNDNVGQFTLFYLEKIVKLLKEKYGIRRLQIENEYPNPAYFVKEAPGHWTLSNEYMRQAFLVVDNILPPEAEIWVNVATNMNAPLQVVELLKKAQQKNPKRVFRLPFNYYFQMEFSHVLGLGRTNLGDTIILNDLTGMNLHQILNMMFESGILPAWSEVQFEPWSDGTERSLKPGNDWRLLAFALLRQQPYVEPLTGSKVPFCMWGLEQLMYWMLLDKADDLYRDEHLKEISLIQTINALSLAS